jgi:murein DD-endopeptidase MepM/ murein hydrolase activator NlpD
MMLGARFWLIIMSGIFLAGGARALEMTGRFIQGGMVIGHTLAGAKVTLDGAPVRVGEDGIFVFGFGRDEAPHASLEVILPDGRRDGAVLDIEQRQYDVQHVDGLAPEMVTPPASVLDRIAREAKRIGDVRATDSDGEAFLAGFMWPAKGRVSGVYGSQRILNGEPKRPHFGLDVAGPVGTPVYAPAAGVVALAEPDLYYTGGTVMIDHGHGITSVLMHMHSLNVRQGDKVRQGDPVGTIGATGRASGPHVDWRVNWFSTYLDPQFLVKEESGR